MKLAKEDDFQTSGVDRNLEERLSEYLSALRTAELASASEPLVGTLYLKTGRLYRQLGNATKAGEYFVGARQYAGATITADNRILLARLQLEEVYLHLDQTGPSLKISTDAQQVLDLLSSNPTPRTVQAWSLVGQAYNVQAIVAQESGQLERFHQLAENAIEAFGRAGDAKRRSLVEFNCATQQHRHGDDVAAIGLLLKYRQTLALIEHDQLFLVAHNLANAYLAIEQLERALQETLACQQEATQTNWIDQLFAIRTLADTYKIHTLLAAEIGWQQSASNYLARLEEASYAGIGLIERKFAPDDADVVHRYHYDLHVMLAEGLAAVGRIAEARDEISQAQAMQAANDNMILAEISGEVERVSAFVAGEAGEWQEAIALLDQAIKSFEQYQLDGKLAAAYIQRARIYLRMNRAEAVQRDLKLATRLSGQLEHQHNKVKIKQLQRQIKSSNPEAKPVEFWQAQDQRASQRLNEVLSEQEQLMAIDLLLSRLIETAVNQFRLDEIQAFAEEAKPIFAEIEQVAQGDTAIKSVGALVLVPTKDTPIAVPSIQILQELIDQRFSLEDLRRLCFDLRQHLPDLDYENLPGESKSAKARELLLYLERRESLLVLASWMWAKRPDLRKGFLS